MDEPSIFTFILFMITGFAFTASSGLVLMIPVKRMISRKKIPNSYVNILMILSTMVSTAFMPLLAQIMTGKSYALLFITVFATTILCVGIGDTIARTLGKHKVNWYSRSIWSEVETQAKHRRLSIGSAIIGKGALYLYPFVIGYGYFGGIYPSQQWPGFFLQSTILLLFVLPFIAELPKITVTLSNKNIITDQRSRILINHLLISSQLFLLIAFMFWEMGWQGRSIGFFSGNIIISTTLSIAFAVYYALFFFVPYTKGQRQARDWHMQLEQRRKDIIEQSEIILNSTNKNSASSALSPLIKKCKEELDSILQLKTIKLARELLLTEEGEKNLQQIAIRDASPRDPRFRHISFMKQAQQALQQYQNCLMAAKANEDATLVSAEVRIKLQQALPPNIDNTRYWKPIILSAFIGIALSLATSSIGHSLAMQLD